MYSAIRKYKINPSDVDEVVRRIHTEFVNLISQAPGFVHYYLVHDGSGTVVTVSVFQDQASADESTRLAAEWIRQNLTSLVQSPPDVTAGEVIVHK